MLSTKNVHTDILSYGERVLSCDSTTVCVGMEPTSPQFDPYQVFEVNRQKGNILRVRVLHGENVSQKWVKRAVDKPDPYVVIWVPDTPNGRKRTKTIDDTENPVWNETFTFYINPKEDKELYVSLKESNVVVDMSYGEVQIQLEEIKLDKEIQKSVTFNNGSTVYLALHRQEDEYPDLRFSLALCSPEKQFTQLRKKRVMEAMKNLLGEGKGPKKEEEVPNIAIIASGGGFRAMTGFSGVMKALHHLGFLDCTMFVAALSGSSWYLSSLYAENIYPTDFQHALRERATKSWLNQLNPSKIYSYASEILEKSKQGQPVSLTDLFGSILGDTLLPVKKKTKLSEFTSRIDRGQMPLPLFTGLHVKKDVSARVYHNWIEFSPYEIGLAKYGTFMDPKYFGNKFYMGRVMTNYEEPPLHYLQGVWGSAYSIFLRRVIERSRRDAVQISNETKEKNQNEREEDIEELLRKYVPGKDDEDEDKDSTNSSDEECEVEEPPDNKSEEKPVETSIFSPVKIKDMVCKNVKECMKNVPRIDYWKKRKDECKLKKQEKKKSFWDTLVAGLFKNTILDSRAGRAAIIFNPMRGLDVEPFCPFSPFTPTTSDDDVEFQGFYEPLEVRKKNMYVVDSGLAFNLPFPLLLRQQRSVQLYLSFDFSNRPGDESPPFEELLLAEEWARINSAAFPPVGKQIEEYLKKPLQECYLFEDPDDPYCPVIIHFILINKEFKKYKDIGVERKTEEEIDFGNFNIFSDPDNPYSSFNMSYTERQFDRLVQLTEFNTRLHANLIRQQIAVAIQRNQTLRPKPLVRMEDIPRLRSTNRHSAELLKRYVTRASSESGKQVTGGEKKTRLP